MSNPEKCTLRREEAIFITPSDRDKGNIHKYARSLFVPAVRNTSIEDVEQSGSLLQELMGILVKKSFINDQQLQVSVENTKRVVECMI
ncbi:hypothetical protein BH23THE1_BH23THE1_00330 [soil metagenome]